MSKPAVTYIKREYRKVFPVFILSVCYAAFVFIILYLSLQNENTDLRLGLAYTDQYSYFETGDMFFGSLFTILNSYHAFAVILFEALLIRKVFYQENRAGVSDFLRILPIRERNKVIMKICAAESAILGFCAVFGLFGTITYNTLRTGFEERAGIFPVEKLMKDAVASDACKMIWQMAFLMFLALSAMFLVLFLLQSCVHNMPAALFAGFGILLAPYYYTSLYSAVSRWGGDMSEVTASFVSHYPFYVSRSADVGYTTVTGYFAMWQCYSKMVWFLAAVILIAAVMLAIGLRLHWNIRESNNTLVNSPAVREFIVTGLSLSVGTGAAYLTGNLPYPSMEMSFMDKYAFFFVTLIVGAVVWALFHVIGMAVMRRQRG